MEYSDIWHQVEMRREALIDFTQALLQTPSPSGQEGAVAAMLQAEMVRLSYDHVWSDEAGNVIGRIAGAEGPSTMFNGHMDHVAPDHESRWQHPPYGAQICKGELWGRAAVDMKGALAAMVYAGGIITSLGLQPPGDLYVSAVVQEEVGGLGARYLSTNLPIPRVVVGEASGNHLRRGHRGRVGLQVRFQGQSVHASSPAAGVNPHFSMARFVELLGETEMAVDPEYGASTVAPTRVTSEPENGNVTPSVVHLALDWRNVPLETPEEILCKVEAVQAMSLRPGCRGFVEVGVKELATYTGYRFRYPDIFPSFTTPKNHPSLEGARSALEAALNREVAVGTWGFATDGAHFAAEGATVLGFGPGDELLAHTVEERLPLDQLLESVVGYVALGMA